MVFRSRIQHMVLRSVASSPPAKAKDDNRADDTAIGEPPDPATLLAEIRSGLRTLGVIQADLIQREQTLLTESSTLYEQLRLNARYLADLHQQQADAAEKTAALQAALQALNDRQSDSTDSSHTSPIRQDALVMQPED